MFPEVVKVMPPNLFFRNFTLDNSCGSIVSEISAPNEKENTMVNQLEY